MSRDSRLAECVAARPGLRVPGAWSEFELGVRAIVGQQVTLSAATRLVGGIAREFGPTLAPERMESGMTHVFPRPEVLARATVVGVPAACARAIARFAEASVDLQLFERGTDLAGSISGLRSLPEHGIKAAARYIAAAQTFHFHL